MLLSSQMNLTCALTLHFGVQLTVVTRKVNITEIGSFGFQNLQHRAKVGDNVLAPFRDRSGEHYYRARVDRIIDERPPSAMVRKINIPADMFCVPYNRHLYLAASESRMIACPPSLQSSDRLLVT